MGYFSTVPCEVLAVEAVSSAVGLVGYGIGIPFDFISNKKERIKDLLGNRFRFTIFNLSDAVLEKVLIKS